MRVGCLTYSTDRGLSHLAKAHYDHGIITDVCLVMRGRMPNHPEWYPPESPQVNLAGMDMAYVRRWAERLDVLLAFETFFDWDLVPWCRKRGIRTVCVPMHECFKTEWPRPDKFICPSLLDLDYFGGTFLPLPVDYPWRLRKRAEVFVHRGGYLGIRGREGTENVIEAMRHVRSPLRLIIQVQENVSREAQRLAAADPRIDYRAETIPYEELYAEGDVAVGAQKWNGCSLPLQEACASGMLVMNTDRYPTNTWLSREPLIPVDHHVKSRIGGAYLNFDEAIVKPEAIAAKMDEYYGKDITAFSLAGKAWAEENSWEKLGPCWLESLSS